MLPAEIPRKAHLIVGKDELAQLTIACLKRIAEAPRPTELPQFADAEKNGRVMLYEFAYENKEWDTLGSLAEGMLEEGGYVEEGVFAIRARYALAQAYISSPGTIETAQKAYTENPEDFESYVAMAVLKIACGQPLHAKEWIEIARTAGGGKEGWFAELENSCDWSLKRANQANCVILPLLLTSEGLEKLKQAMVDPAEFEDASFLAAIEAIRSNPEVIQKEKESNSILLDLFNRIALTSPVRWNLPEVNVNPEACGVFAKLTDPVMKHLTTYLQAPEVIKMKEACRPLYFAFDTPMIWRHVWSQFSGASFTSARGEIPAEEVKEHCHRIINCFFIMEKFLVLRKSMTTSKYAQILTPPLMTELRNYMACLNSTGHIPYDQPLLPLLYALQDLVTLWPKADLATVLGSSALGVIFSSMIGELNCGLQHLVSLETLVRYASRSYDFAETSDILGFGSLATQLISDYPISGSAGVVAIRSRSALQLETPRVLRLSTPSHLYEQHRLSPINFSGLFHMRIVYHDFTFRGRYDYAICRLQFSNPTEENEITAYTVTGDGHDTVRGAFKIKPWGRGFIDDKAGSLAFLLEHEDGTRFKFLGGLSATTGFSGVFDVYNELEPTLGEFDNMISTNPRSLVGQGLKSAKSNALLGSFLLMPEDETDLETLKNVADKYKIKISDFQGDKYEMWKTFFLRPGRDDLDEINRNVDPWLVEQPHPAAETHQFAIECASRAQLMYSNQCTIFHMMNLFNRIQQVPSDDELQSIIDYPTTNPAFTQKPTESDGKFDRRSHLFYICTAFSFQSRGAMSAQDPANLLENIRILQNSEHPDHLKVHLYYLQLFCIGPWENSANAETLASDLQSAYNAIQQHQHNPNLQTVQPDLSEFFSKKNTKKRGGLSLTTFIAIALIGTAAIGAGAFAIGKYFGRRGSKD